MGTIADTPDKGRAQGVEWPQYFVDTSNNPWDLNPYKIYARDCDEVLGDENGVDVSDDIDPGLQSRVARQNRCFNCGSPEHTVSSCPLPQDRALISLSRALFQFLQDDRGLENWKRVHVVEEWRQQRLNWLEDFEPGEIRSTLLQEAIGSGDGDWLKNMTLWGYPPGWVCDKDPRERIKDRIWNEYVGDNDGLLDDEAFFIYNEEHHFEQVSFSTPPPNKIVDENEIPESDSESEDSAKTPTSDNCFARNTRRWAKYPNTHFASDLLPVYNGFALPSVTFSPTYTSERQDLWQSIIAGAHHTSNQPPPPSEPPPSPPPPPPNSPPPLPSHPFGTVSNSYISQPQLVDTDEMDMEMSDSDSD